MILYYRSLSTISAATGDTIANFTSVKKPDLIGTGITDRDEIWLKYFNFRLKNKTYPQLTQNRNKDTGRI